MSIFRSCVFTFLFAIWASTASAVQLFIINQFDANLYRVDTDALVTPELVGQVTFGTDVIELATASSDRLYTFDRAFNTVITISSADASILNTASLDRNIPLNPRGFDVSPTDGQLYGVFPGLELRTIDPATGVTTLVTALIGVNTIEAIAFSPDGTLYAAASPTGNMGTHLYTINSVSGVLSLIGSMGLEIDTLGYASDGFLYGAISGPGRRILYRIDPDTALRTVVGDTGVNSIVGITEPAVEPPIPDISISIVPDGTEQECSESGGTSVQLTAEVSDGFIASVTWTIDGIFAGDTETISPFLALGSHLVQVDVVTDTGGTGSATEAISVADTTPPEIHAAFIDAQTGQEITQASPSDRVSPSVNVTDVCDPEPAINAVVGIPAEDGGIFFTNQTPKSTLLRSNTSPGYIELSISASDASGNTATENIQLELVK